MPIERILSEDDINKVIRANSKPPFAIRNKAMVLGSTYWLLTAYELSELRFEDVTTTATKQWPDKVTLQKTAQGQIKTLEFKEPLNDADALKLQMFIQKLMSN